MPGIPTRSLVAVEAVAAVRKLEVFGGHFVLLKSGVKYPAVFRWDGSIVHGVGKVDGGRFIAHLFFVGKKLYHFCVGVVAEQVALGTAVSVFAHGDHGVDQNGKVGPAGNPVEKVLGGRPTGLGKVSGGSASQVPACRKANDPHLVGVDLPFLGPVTDQSDGPLGILERNEGTTLGQTVLENHAGDTMAVEPLSDAMSLGPHDEPSVASARANDGCGAVWLGRAMQVNPASFLVLDTIDLLQGNLFRLGQEEDRKEKKREYLE